MAFNNLCCFPLIANFLERYAKRVLLAARDLQLHNEWAVINLTDCLLSVMDLSIMDSQIFDFAYFSLQMTSLDM